MKNKEFTLIPIGERIRSRRMQLHISQEELARRAGYGGKSAINKIEKGVNGIPQDKVVLFARALQTTELYLLGMVDDPDVPLDKIISDAQPVEDNLIDLNDEESILIERYRTADTEKKRLIAFILGIDK